jgi:hypothetical protein
LALVFLFIHSNEQQKHELYVMKKGRTQEFFRRGPTLLFPNYNYNLIQYQQINFNNYSNSHNSYRHITHILQKGLL